MFWPVICTNTLLSEPHRPPNITSTIMRRPRLSIRLMSPTPPLLRPSTPSSTMRLIMSGCSRSMVTSPTMNSVASTA